MPSHTETWRDHTSYARRAHVHGPIRSLREDARAMGEPSWLAGTALVIACLLAVLGAVLVLHAVFAPAASAPSSLQAQAAHPSTGVEAAGKGEIS